MKICKNVRNSRQDPERGFTLIELIVVFSVTALLSMIGFASFSNFAASQNMNNALLDLKTILGTARSQALSQVKPSVCGSQVLSGYVVNICCTSGCYQNCINTSGANYELNVLCSGSQYNLSVYNKTVPSNITISPQSTSYSFYFPELSANIMGSGQVVLQTKTPIAGFVKTRIATVSATGIIQ